MGEDRKEVEFEEVQFEEARVVLNLPVNAVAAKIEVTVFENGELVKAERELSLADLRQAFKDGEDVILEDDTFTLTDKGSEYINPILKN